MVTSRHVYAESVFEQSVARWSSLMSRILGGFLRLEMNGDVELKSGGNRISARRGPTCDASW